MKDFLDLLAAAEVKASLHKAFVFVSSLIGGVTLQGINSFLSSVSFTVAIVYGILQIQSLREAKRVRKQMTQVVEHAISDSQKGEL